MLDYRVVQLQIHLKGCYTLATLACRVASDFGDLWFEAEASLKTNSFKGDFRDPQ